MKNTLIITLIDYTNYGNRLQNYALTKWLEKNNIHATSLREASVMHRIKTMVKLLVNNRKKMIRYIKFWIFSKKYINTMIKNNNNKIKDYDYYIVGSDQVWNPNYALTDTMLLNDIESNNKIAYAASFGISELPEKFKYRVNKLKNFKAISVREDDGKKIINNIIDRKDVEVLIDPTMLLKSDEWNKIAKKPKKLKKDRYILNYFLGGISDYKQKKIEKIAQKYKCRIINILDKNDTFYTCDPSEFIYLEKNAFLICTDSFHSSVFAIIFNVPFIVFDREHEKDNNMNSRIETLLSKFKLENRKFNGEFITNENLKVDYTEAYKILEQERNKASNFLYKSLDIKENNIERK